MLGPRRAAFPYRGGKFHLAPRIVKLLPPHRVYVEVFGGAASVLIAKSPSQIEVYNDSNSLLVNLFETIRNRPISFLDRARGIVYSRELYEKWKEELTPELVRVDPTEAAVKTLYCLASSFIGDPRKGWAFHRDGRDGGPNRWVNLVDRVFMLTERFRHVAIDHLDFRDCIEYWDTNTTCFFLDPPYISSVSQSGFYMGDFRVEDHQDLVRILRGVQGKWLMTLDDTPQLRELYKDFQIQPLSTILSSQKVPKGGKRVRFHQLLIANYEIGDSEQRSTVPAAATATRS